MIVLIILAIISIVILLWQVSNIVSVLFGSLYVMADKKVILESLKLAGLKKGDVFYDLGCGRGDVLIEAEKFFAKAIGYEISPFYFLLSKMKIFFYKILCYLKRSSVKSSINIQIFYQRIENVNLRKADVVYCYLLPKFLKKLSPKFLKELKPGARLISIGFPIKISPNYAGAKKRDKYVFENHKIYIYRF